jgi:hypothetical protein
VYWPFVNWQAEVMTRAGGRRRRRDGEVNRDDEHEREANGLEHLSIGNLHLWISFRPRLEAGAGRSVPVLHNFML